MPTDLFLAQTPPANLQPVHFDFGAAQRAAQALRTMADAVDRSARMRAADGRVAEKSWYGGQQVRFGRAESQLDATASSLVRRLHEAADKLHDAATSARAENRRREGRLADWKQDLASARKREIEARNRAAKDQETP